MESLLDKYEVGKYDPHNLRTIYFTCLLTLVSACGDGEHAGTKLSTDPNLGEDSAGEEPDGPGSVPGAGGSGSEEPGSSAKGGRKATGGNAAGCRSIDDEDPGSEDPSDGGPDGEEPGAEDPGEDPGSELPDDETPPSETPDDELPICEVPEDPGPAQGGTGGEAPQGTGGTTGGASTGGSAGTPSSGGQAPTPGYPKACSDIYDPAIVPTFELEMSTTELAGLEDDCEAQLKVYRPATFRYGNETVEVMVRLKGNWSFRCDKKQFLISFNEVNSKGRFHGQRKIVLDAPWYDQTLLAERLAFSFMKRAGNLSSCVNNARLFLNGEYYGAFSNVERIDKEYLQRQFPKADAEGNLWEGGGELKTNEELNDTTQLDALRAATNAASIDALADLDQAVKLWASLAVLPDPDSYWAGVEDNHYLYEHPSRGFIWLPADMDLSMRQLPADAGAGSGDFAVQQVFVNADPLLYENAGWMREPILKTVLSDETWCNRFLDGVREALDAYDPELMSDELDTWAAQIASAVEEDPNRVFPFQTHLDSIARMKEFIPARRAFVSSWLASASCPVEW